MWFTFTLLARVCVLCVFFFFFSSRRRHTRSYGDWSSDVCSSDLRREMTRSSNTGLLALRALVNSEMRIRGEGREMLDLKDLLTPQYRTFLFYPSDEDRKSVV